jgi:hypothetical protein
MGQPRHDAESFKPLDQDAAILPFKMRSSEASAEQEQDLVGFYLEHWLTIEGDAKAVAEAVITDIDATTEDERQMTLKTAVDKSPLYDHYDAIYEADSILNRLDTEIRSMSGEGLTVSRKALLALLDVRAVELVESPDRDIEAQLARLPYGDEDKWGHLIDRILGQS